MFRRLALITAGPTREHLDPVRFLSNASSGRQGVALAEEAALRSWRVALVHGPLEVAVPPGVDAYPVVSAAEMLSRCLELHPSSAVVVGAAAVSDYRAAAPLAQKRKHDDRPWQLDLVPTPDILATLGTRKAGRIHAGFALETDELLARAGEKLRRKHLDWIVANEPAAIGAEHGEYVLLGARGERRAIGRVSKRDLARALWDAIEDSTGR